jgi:EAL domain-containing protein (putative c-di-GMP-specific phosphodiesterase class I)
MAGPSPAGSTVVHSFCRAAEELVRAGGGESLPWRDVVLTSHFQPIYGVQRESCVGYEALVRAADAGGRPVAPQALFETAFRDAQGVELDWICRAMHLRNFARVDPGDRKLFINIHSQAAVRDFAVAGEFSDLVRFYGLSPKRVCVEILEDSCGDESVLRKTVAAYRRAGAAIAMDDFGLGRSNFDRIVALRPDVVKIDRSILTDAVGDQKARRMLPAVIELLHEAGAEVAVEGVESAGEAMIAIDSGADQLQGNYFGPPAARLADEEYGASVITRLMRMRVGRIAAVAD